MNQSKQLLCNTFSGVVFIVLHSKQCLYSVLWTLLHSLSLYVACSLSEIIFF